MMILEKHMIQRSLPHMIFSEGVLQDVCMEICLKIKSLYVLIVFRSFEFVLLVGDHSFLAIWGYPHMWTLIHQRLCFFSSNKWLMQMLSTCWTPCGRT